MTEAEKNILPSDVALLEEWAENRAKERELDGFERLALKIARAALATHRDLYFSDDDPAGVLKNAQKLFAKIDATLTAAGFKDITFDTSQNGFAVWKKLSP